MSRILTCLCVLWSNAICLWWPECQILSFNFDLVHTVCISWPGISTKIIEKAPSDHLCLLLTFPPIPSVLICNPQWFASTQCYQSQPRLNTGEAPTCNWMIKIVKVNSYILTSCSWILYNLMPPSRTMNQQREWKHRCVEQEMGTNITKRRQSLSFSFSGVVQRYSGDDLSICLPTALTKLV